MSDLLVIAYDDEATAFEVRAELIRMQQEYLLQLEDAVVVTRPEGKVTLHQPVNLTATGALGGTMWGTLIGLIFLNPLLGAAVGAASGAVAGRLTDIGINDDFIRQVGESVPPGGSAVFLLIRKMTTDRVMQRLEGFGKRGRILRTSLSDADEERLREAVAGTGGRVEPTSEAEAPTTAMEAPAGTSRSGVEPTSEVEAPTTAMVAPTDAAGAGGGPTSEAEAPASGMTAPRDAGGAPAGPTSEAEAPPSTTMTRG